MIEEIEHLNEPERIKQLIKDTYPDLYKRKYQT